MTERYAGGMELTGFLLEMAGLSPCRILDMDPHAAETVAYLKELGFDAVAMGDGELADFDAVISEGTFHETERGAGEAARYLKQGGMLLLADVCLVDVKEHIAILEQAGFHVLHVEDATALWMELYPEQCSKCRYFLTICEKL